MVRAVAQDGYAKTTLATIVDLASVSRSTFYQHFRDKQDCFLQTQDVIIEVGLREVSAAYRSQSDWRERLRAGFHAFMDVIVSDPEAAQMVAVEALGAGTEAVRRRDAATAAFEQLFRQSFDQARAQGRVSDITIRAIAGGIRRVVYLHLRDGTADQLPGYVDELLEWALSYQQPDVDVPRKPPVRRETPAEEPTSRTIEGPAGGDRRSLGHRRRILDAVTLLVARDGYGALKIPDISAAAGISNQTFYAHFKDKHEALLAAFDDAASDTVQATLSAFSAAPNWPEAVRCGLAALLTHLADRPAFARLAMVELQVAGKLAQSHADLTINGFGAFLLPESGATTTVPPVVIQAITGGVWYALHYEYMNGRLHRLPSLTPSLAFVVLAPFLGASVAAATARGPAR